MNKIFLLSFSIFSLPTFANLSINNPVQGEGWVYRVIDGDTYEVNVVELSTYEDLRSKSSNKKFLKDKYKSFRLRLANIDTAESKHPDKSKNSQEGLDASKYVKNLIEKQKIDFSCWDQGKYGRFICSVSIYNEDLGLKLIDAGYSKYITKYGRHPYLNFEYSNK